MRYRPDNLISFLWRFCELKEFRRAVTWHENKIYRRYWAVSPYIQQLVGDPMSSRRPTSYVLQNLADCNSCCLPTSYPITRWTAEYASLSSHERQFVQALKLSILHCKRPRNTKSRDSSAATSISLKLHYNHVLETPAGKVNVSLLGLAQREDINV